jgi:hypothetical protein
VVLQGQITGKEEGVSEVSTGKIGAQTSIRTARDAGVSFKLHPKERKRLAKARRDFKKLASVQTLRGERDMSPRLVKR